MLGTHRGLLAPQLMHEHITRDRLVRPQQQDDQQRTQPWAANVNHPAVRADLKLPENPVVDHVAASPTLTVRPSPQCTVQEIVRDRSMQVLAPVVRFL
jgi:hypothetical protein